MIQGPSSGESSLHRCSWTQLCCLSRGIRAGTSFITQIGPCTKQPNIKIHHKSLKTNCNLSHQVFVTSAYCPHLGANLGVGGRVSFPHLIHLHLIHLKLIHLLHLTFDFGVLRSFEFWEVCHLHLILSPGERGLYKVPLPRLEVWRQHWDMRRGGSHQSETNCDANCEDCC